MSSVSADNVALTGAVASLEASYRRFQDSLRGQVAVVLVGLANGTHSMMSMNQALESVAQDYLNSSRIQTLVDLGEVSHNAFITTKAGSELDLVLSQKALSVADALHKGFAAEIESSIERAVARDVRTSLDFIRTQVSQGRFVATNEELVHDLKFQITGKMTLDTAEFVKREVNWAYRQQYNTLVVHTLLARGIEVALIDGGSSDGLELNLMNYDQTQAKYFHHNTKALLQPLDGAV
jgi:hypothetical protein